MIQLTEEGLKEALKFEKMLTIIVRPYDNIPGQIVKISDKRQLPQTIKIIDGNLCVNVDGVNIPSMIMALARNMEAAKELAETILRLEERNRLRYDTLNNSVSILTKELFDFVTTKLQSASVNNAIKTFIEFVKAGAYFRIGEDELVWRSTAYQNNVGPKGESLGTITMINMINQKATQNDLAEKIRKNVLFVENPQREDYDYNYSFNTMVHYFDLPDGEVFRLIFENAEIISCKEEEK